MHSLKPVFDFPPGYPDFESIKKEADDILTSGHYIDVFHHGQAPIITDKLRRKIKDGEGTNAQYFYPISELYLAGKLPIIEIRNSVNTLFTELAKKALASSYNKEADHIPMTFFLAWGIANRIFSEGELKKIKFDHGDEKGEYYGQKYVLSYGCTDIESIVDRVTEDITFPEKIAQKRQQDKSDKAKASKLLQERVGSQVYDCFCEYCL